MSLSSSSLSALVQALAQCQADKVIEKDIQFDLQFTRGDTGERNQGIIVLNLIRPVKMDQTEPGQFSTLSVSHRELVAWRKGGGEEDECRLLISKSH